MMERYVILLLLFFMISCSDDNNDSSCDTFLSCSAQSLWFQQRNDDVVKYLRILDDLANPIEVWDNDGIEGGCYYYEDFVFGFGVNDFNIVENIQNRMVIQTSDGNVTEIITYTISNNGVLSVASEFPNNPEYEDELRQYISSNVNVDNLTLCE